MNGRELTAQDVEFNFHRLLGTGSGFTEPSETLTYGYMWPGVKVASVTATDESTVEFKLQEPALTILHAMLHENGSFIYPPEVIQEHGDANDWRNLVGTGPMMLTEWVEGSSWTWEKNPDYWGYDEKYPENRLPYVDRVRALKMVESATYLAALRTGKVDYLGFGFATRLNLEEADAIKRSNPEIALWPFGVFSNQALLTNPNKPPFDDIRVRHALEMALDHETVNDTYFKGLGVWKPEGFLGPTLKGYVTPFEEWPQEVKQFYTYDPAAVELTQASSPYFQTCLLYTSPSPRDRTRSRMPSSA